jgi:cytochrome bd-type quinol oxidase subunit 1
LWHWRAARCSMPVTGSPQIVGTLLALEVVTAFFLEA